MHTLIADVYRFSFDLVPSSKWWRYLKKGSGFETNFLSNKGTFKDDTYPLWVTFARNLVMEASQKVSVFDSAWFWSACLRMFNAIAWSCITSRETSIEQQFIRVAQIYNLHDDLSSFCAAHACTRSCYDVQQKTRTAYVCNASCTSILLYLWSGSRRYCEIWG